MFQSSKLKNKIWVYLVLFSIIILLFLWFLQVVFLNIYYELSVTSDLNKVANQIENVEIFELQTKLDNIAFDHGFCIEAFSNNTLVYSSNNLNRGCLGEENLTFYKYKNEFISGDKIQENYRMINNRFNNKTLIKAVKYENYSIFINASLEPLDATTNILASQLILVTVVVLALSLLVSYFISKNISKPIIKLNDMAREISKGNYNIKNDTRSQIEEIDELGDTLNKTALELSKTETLRRELMANVSHDLKTPLTMIKAYSELVRDVTYKDKRKREENLNLIIEETDRLNLLVNDILELSKIQANTEESIIEQFDIDLLIKNVLNKFKILEQEDGYNFVYSGEENVIVKSDQKRLERVIYNLIDNAIKYTGEDKKVIVNLTNLEKSVRVEIRDTGKGINENEIKYIWDKYYKVDKSYSRNFKSTGIGLSIVKNICIKNNINYGVESKKNKGSIFWIEVEK